jgi:uncharacterized membrane protein YeaQ/YmgE (transglycosylase-associated protein family)
VQRAAPGTHDGLKEEVPPVELIGFIVFGLVVGVIARLIVPGKQRLGIAGTLLIGVAGSIVGGVIAHELGTGDLWELNLLGSLIAIATAALLIALIDGPRPRRRRTSRRRSWSRSRRRSLI